MVASSNVLSLHVLLYYSRFNYLYIYVKGMFLSRFWRGMYWQLVLSVPILLATEAVLTRGACLELSLHKYRDGSVGDDGPHATALQDLHSQTDVNI
ncbi:hypothetical protein PAHAL_5G118900 [Panicum hallii]|uniref:Uncharacterized protein n=1 Tax=Panicum hallii TaxID=206008 RepID=A0A2T8IJV1_9POAL|nr:hypothetical protein PAHAL_5G118900 [Panicum hallii]